MENEKLIYGGSNVSKRFLENRILEDAVNLLIKKLDNLMIEGLKLKGFEFNNKTELIQFISSRVTCHDKQDIQEKTYLVDNIPFFLHKYNINFCDTINDNNTFTANYGEYKFL
jgi:hypothetical protein